MTTSTTVLGRRGVTTKDTRPPSLPPAVQGVISGHIHLIIDSTSTLSKPLSAYRINYSWWGDSAVYTLRYGPPQVAMESRSTRQTQVTATFPVKASPPQLFAYLRDMGSFALDVFLGPKHVGVCVLKDVCCIAAKPPREVSGAFPIMTSTRQTAGSLSVRLFYQNETPILPPAIYNPPSSSMYESECRSDIDVGPVKPKFNSQGNERRLLPPAEASSSKSSSISLSSESTSSSSFDSSISSLLQGLKETTLSGKVQAKVKDPKTVMAWDHLLEKARDISSRMQASVNGSKSEVTSNSHANIAEMPLIDNSIHSFSLSDDEDLMLQFSVLKSSISEKTVSSAVSPPSLAAKTDAPSSRANLAPSSHSISVVFSRVEFPFIVSLCNLSVKNQREPKYLLNNLPGIRVKNSKVFKFSDTGHQTLRFLSEDNILVEIVAKRDRQEYKFKGSLPVNSSELLNGAHSEIRVPLKCSAGDASLFAHFSVTDPDEPPPASKKVYPGLVADVESDIIELAQELNKKSRDEISSPSVPNIIAANTSTLYHLAINVGRTHSISLPNPMSESTLLYLHIKLLSSWITSPPVPYISPVSAVNSANTFALSQTNFSFEYSIPISSQTLAQTASLPTLPCISEIWIMQDGKTSLLGIIRLPLGHLFSTALDCPPGEQESLDIPTAAYVIRDPLTGVDRGWVNASLHLSSAVYQKSPSTVTDPPELRFDAGQQTSFSSVSSKLEVLNQESKILSAAPTRRNSPVRESKLADVHQDPSDDFSATTCILVDILQILGLEPPITVKIAIFNGLTAKDIFAGVGMTAKMKFELSITSALLRWLRDDGILEGSLTDDARKSVLFAVDLKPLLTSTSGLKRVIPLKLGNDVHASAAIYLHVHFKSMPLAAVPSPRKLGRFVTESWIVQGFEFIFDNPVTFVWSGADGVQSKQSEIADPTNLSPISMEFDPSMGGELCVFDASSGDYFGFFYVDPEPSRRRKLGYEDSSEAPKIKELYFLPYGSFEFKPEVLRLIKRMHISPQKSNNRFEASPADVPQKNTPSTPQKRSDQISIQIFVDRASGLPLLNEPGGSPFLPKNIKSQMVPPSSVLLITHSNGRVERSATIKNTINPVFCFSSSFCIPRREVMSLEDKYLHFDIMAIPSWESSEFILGTVKVACRPLLHGLDVIEGWYPVLDPKGANAGQLFVKVSPQQSLGSFTFSPKRPFAQNSSPASAIIVPEPKSNNVETVLNSMSGTWPENTTGGQASRQIDTWVWNGKGWEHKKVQMQENQNAPERVRPASDSSWTFKETLRKSLKELDSIAIGGKCSEVDSASGCFPTDLLNVNSSIETQTSLNVKDASSSPMNMSIITTQAITSSVKDNDDVAKLHESPSVLNDVYSSELNVKSSTNAADYPSLMFGSSSLTSGRSAKRVSFSALKPVEFSPVEAVDSTGNVDLTNINENQDFPDARSQRRKSWVSESLEILSTRTSTVRPDECKQILASASDSIRIIPLSNPTDFAADAEGSAESNSSGGPESREQNDTTANSSLRRGSWLTQSLESLAVRSPVIPRSVDERIFETINASSLDNLPRDELALDESTIRNRVGDENSLVSASDDDFEALAIDEAIPPLRRGSWMTQSLEQLTTREPSNLESVSEVDTEGEIDLPLPTGYGANQENGPTEFSATLDIPAEINGSSIPLEDTKGEQSLLDDLARKGINSVDMPPQNNEIASLAMSDTLANTNSAEILNAVVTKAESMFDVKVMEENTVSPDDNNDEPESRSLVSEHSLVSLEEELVLYQNESSFLSRLSVPSIPRALDPFVKEVGKPPLNPSVKNTQNAFSSIIGGYKAFPTEFKSMDIKVDNLPATESVADKAPLISKEEARRLKKIFSLRSSPGDEASSS